MKTLFYYEAIVGLICILAVLFFGQSGGATIALMALQPFLWKGIKLSDSDKILFKKVNSNSIFLFIGLFLPIIVFFEQAFLFGEELLFIVGGCICLAHGIMGLKFFVFQKE